ncbi:type II secretion system protein [Candidatus Kaiserbacteria bacterium]|nr:type II secretion system protein [Candidatus Kaiserbacteria bacterium]
MQLRARTTQSGFTLIEMIVSLGLFSIVITVAVGALLVLIANNKQLQQEQGVMTNLSFALDSMTREIRTGTKYFCESANNKSQLGKKSMFKDSTDLDTLLLSTDVQDCWKGRGGGSAGNLHGIAFIEGGDSITGSGERILYFYDKNNKSIYRKVGGNPAESIVSNGIEIVDFDLIVTGSTPLRTAAYELDQPAVTIYIKAVDKQSPTAKPYYVQTTIVQRTLDI